MKTLNRVTRGGKKLGTGSIPANMTESGFNTMQAFYPGQDALALGGVVAGMPNKFVPVTDAPLLKQFAGPNKSLPLNPAL